MAFPLSNEAEVEEGQKENRMDDGAHAADLGRLGKVRAQERHRNASQVEILNMLDSLGCLGLLNSSVCASPLV